ncbi:probable phospholipase A2 homolog 1 [Lolium perenne]|nr:probable phospholipase A2 homolog 1 [Lolium perenne]
MPLRQSPPPITMAMLTPPLAAVVLVLLLLGSAAASAPPPPPCSRSCASLNCDSVGIRYGKFCGVGWSGCEGEEPCDDLDACCRDHDYCVEKKGLMSIKCHEKFKNCMRKVKKAGKTGFSIKCPYELAMATMTQGMDMAIMLSQLGSQKLEL